MRIFLITFEYPPVTIGGIGTHTKDLADALAVSGIEVIVISTPVNTALDILCKKDNPRIYREVMDVPHPVDMDNAVASGSFVRMAQLAAIECGMPDIIHCQESKAWAATRYLSDLWKVPYICTVHSTEFRRRFGQLNNEQQTQELERIKMIRGANYAICVSEFLLNDVHEQFNEPREKLRLIHNGIRVEDAPIQGSSPRVMNVKRLARNRSIILFVGRLGIEKGPQVFLDIAIEMLSRRNDICFFLAGDGKLRESLEERVQRSSFEESIYFLGYQPHEIVMQLYKCATIVLIPSLYDTFPLTALEALMSKGTVIAANVGGLKELISSETGVLLPDHDPCRWADTIESILTDEDRRKLLGSKGHLLVKQKFSSTRMALDTIHVYEEVLRT